MRANLSLPDAVILLADAPTSANREAFFRTLVASRLGARTTAEIPPGQHTLGAQEVTFPTSTAPDGSPMILTWCDIPGMLTKFPDDRFFEVDARVVLQMAANSGFGIIVQYQSGDAPTWAGVGIDDVARILSSET